MENLANKSEIIVIKNRQSFTMNGVSNIIEFDEGYVELEAGERKINIGGNGLKVDSLQKNNGEISIVGTIKFVEFDLENKKNKKHR